VPYYLGIDGGGTKTTCAVGDDTQLVATATGGPSNIIRVGEARARESLHRAVRQACSAAVIAPAQIARTCIGAAGAARPEIAEAIRRALAEILSTPIDVVGDMQTALEAAFDTGAGVIVNAGTGSFAYGRNREGVTARAGGWGFAIGDEGSAHWIGREAVRAVLQASDRTSWNSRTAFECTPYVEALMKVWGTTSLSDFARAANSIPPPDFAALFPAVAASEDELARQILSRAGRELAHIAAVVIQRLFAANESKDEIKTIPVAMIGGVFRHSILTRDDFYNELHRLDPRVEINPNVVDPVEGALRMARRAAAEDEAVPR
jgi:glucosamine kinase